MVSIGVRCDGGELSGGVVSMRRTKLLLLCSSLAPSTVLVAGCNNNNASGTPVEAGSVDVQPIQFDGPTPFEAAVHDAGPVPDAPGPADATVEASPSGIIPPIVDFMTVGCGAPAASQTFTVTNTGTVPVTY